MKLAVVTAALAAVLGCSALAFGLDPPTDYPPADSGPPPAQQYPPLGAVLSPSDEYALKADLAFVNVSGGGTAGVVVNAIATALGKTIAKGSATTTDVVPVVYIPLKMNAVAKKRFKKKKVIPLAVKLTITPPGHPAITKTVTIKLHRGKSPSGCYRGSAPLHIAC